MLTQMWPFHSYTCFAYEYLLVSDVNNKKENEQINGNNVPLFDPGTQIPSPILGFNIRQLDYKTLLRILHASARKMSESITDLFDPQTKPFQEQL